jgi:hypothetical protein
MRKLRIVLRGRRSDWFRRDWLGRKFNFIRICDRASSDEEHQKRTGRKEKQDDERQRTPLFAAAACL